MKKCNGPCGVEKPLTEFGRRTYKNGVEGYRSFCRTCNKQARDDWRALNRDRDNARNLAYNKRNAARIRGHKLRKYWPGTTAEQALVLFAQLLESQGGKCAICGTVKRRTWHVDHCHKAAKVRGILCNQCNRGLGFFGDNDRILFSAATYLAKNKKP